MSEPRTLRLGRLPARIDKRTLKIASYINPLLTPPEELDWGANVEKWRMFKNDELGDCTCAAAGHSIMNWTANTGRLFIPTDEEIVKAYQGAAGYIPGNPQTDNGAIELDVLKYWANTGVAGHKIGAFVSVNPRSMRQLKIATWLFGSIYTGVSLTDSDMDAVYNKQSWEYDESNLVGGHAIIATGYTKNTFKFVTWGETQTASYQWVIGRMDEAWAIISEDWLLEGKSPSGFNMDQLREDLKFVRG